MKEAAGFVAVKIAALLALAIALGSCSAVNKPCQDPMSCACPTSPNPGCAPWVNDNGDNPSDMAKKKNQPGGATAQDHR